MYIYDKIQIQIQLATGYNLNYTGLLGASLVV